MAAQPRPSAPASQATWPQAALPPDDPAPLASSAQPARPFGARYTSVYVLAMSALHAWAASTRLDRAGALGQWRAAARMSAPSGGGGGLGRRYQQHYGLGVEGRDGAGPRAGAMRTDGGGADMRAMQFHRTGY
jgi:hypothetical protein